MGYYKIVGTQVHTANTQIDSEFKSFTKEILEDGLEMYQPQELQDALDVLKLEEDKATQIAEATKYLSDTDWVIVKITEMQLEGVDTASLMEKYKEELISRTYYRNLINQLEGDSNE